MDGLLVSKTEKNGDDNNSAFSSDEKTKKYI